MCTETLLVKVGGKLFNVYFEDYSNGLAVNAELPCLRQKTSKQVWQWARLHRAKIYFQTNDLNVNLIKL